ncbi:MAG: hypothetical protein K6G50_09840 [bacterium]|nr:hypothetical protein [bacterium]
MELTINSFDKSNSAKISAGQNALAGKPPHEEAGGEASVKDSFSKASRDIEADDVSRLAKRIVGQYGKTETVQVLSGTDGSDEIRIANGKEGGLEVTVNGEVHSFDAEAAKKLVINGGDGDDTIIAADDVKAQLFITGGAGNDLIVGGAGNDFIIDSSGRNIIDGKAGNDSIISSGLDLPKGSAEGSILLGGDGNDYIEGGTGADIIDGGAGNNVIYGLDGDDFITAGNGRNYIDGGRGDDNINNAGAMGMLFGGQGNDTIVSSQRASIIADSLGDNSISADQGADKILSEQPRANANPSAGGAASSAGSANSAGSAAQGVAPIDIPANFNISGSESFKARVQSDLDTLRQIGIGQKMLSEIAATGFEVKITETSNNGNQCSSGKDGHLREDKTPGPGTSSTIQYNRAGLSISRRDEPWAERPPVVGLFHEMAHSYNAATGTMDYGCYRYDGTKADDHIGLVGAEYQAVGIEHPLIQSNPGGLNENGLRKFLGLEERTRY